MKVNHAQCLDPLGPRLQYVFTFLSVLTDVFHLPHVQNTPRRSPLTSHSVSTRTVPFYRYTNQPHSPGHRSSRPVRIGNGAAFHKQLDIYGELLDAIYLFNKYGKPVSYDQWLLVRSLADYVCTIWREPDMSIWEVRGRVQNFTYSKMMLWVALDRAVRLAEKRCFPCPRKAEWLGVRDSICEEVMERGFNGEMGAFVQSYESNEVGLSLVVSGATGTDEHSIALSPHGRRRGFS